MVVRQIHCRANQKCRNHSKEKKGGFRRCKSGHYPLTAIFAVPEDQVLTYWTFSQKVKTQFGVSLEWSLNSCSCLFFIFQLVSASQ